MRNIKKTVVFIPYISIKPRYSFSSSYNPEPRSKTSSQVENEKNLRNNSTEGVLSKKASKAIKLAIDWMVICANPDFVWSRSARLNFQVHLKFITLTLPCQQFHTDLIIKSQCLHQFLVEIEKYHGVHNYVWRAEAQRNGNIHFHITTDKFIHHQDVAEIWNRCISKLGYIDKYRENQLQFHKDGFQLHADMVKNWNESPQRVAYEKGMTQNWCSPPTTQIKAVKNTSELSNYLALEFTKNKNKDIFYKEFRPLNSDLDTSRLPQFQEFFDTGNCKAEVTPITTGKHAGKERWDYFIPRRPIEGRLWFVGGPIASKKGIHLDLSNAQRTQISEYRLKHPEYVRSVDTPKKPDGTSFTLGTLLIAPIQIYKENYPNSFSSDVANYFADVKKGTKIASKRARVDHSSPVVQASFSPPSRSIPDADLFCPF